MEKKTVVQGGFGAVPMEENGRRYIDAEPVEVPMTGYYLRRMMSGELVEYVEQPASAPEATPAPALVMSTPPVPAAGGSGGGGGGVVELKSFDLSEKEEA